MPELININPTTSGPLSLVQRNIALLSISIATLAAITAIMITTLIALRTKEENRIQESFGKRDFHEIEEIREEKKEREEEQIEERTIEEQKSEEENLINLSDTEEQNDNLAPIVQNQRNQAEQNNNMLSTIQEEREEDVSKTNRARFKTNNQNLHGSTVTNAYLPLNNDDSIISKSGNNNTIVDITDQIQFDNDLNISDDQNKTSEKLSTKLTPTPRPRKPKTVLTNSISDANTQDFPQYKKEPQAIEAKRGATGTKSMITGSADTNASMQPIENTNVTTITSSTSINADKLQATDLYNKNSKEKSTFENVKGFIDENYYKIQNVRADDARIIVVYSSIFKKDLQKDCEEFNLVDTRIENLSKERKKSSTITNLSIKIELDNQKEVNKIIEYYNDKNTPPPPPASEPPELSTNLMNTTSSINSGDPEDLNESTRSIKSDGTEYLELPGTFGANKVFSFNNTNYRTVPIGQYLNTSLDTSFDETDYEEHTKALQNTSEKNPQLYNTISSTALNNLTTNSKKDDKTQSNQYQQNLEKFNKTAASNNLYGSDDELESTLYRTHKTNGTSTLLSIPNNHNNKSINEFLEDANKINGDLNRKIFGGNLYSDSEQEEQDNSDQLNLRNQVGKSAFEKKTNVSPYIDKDLNNSYDESDNDDLNSSLSSNTSYIFNGTPNKNFNLDDSTASNESLPNGYRTKF